MGNGYQTGPAELASGSGFDLVYPGVLDIPKDLPGMKKPWILFPKLVDPVDRDPAGSVRDNGVDNIFFQLTHSHECSYVYSGKYRIVMNGDTPLPRLTQRNIHLR